MVEPDHRCFHRPKEDPPTMARLRVPNPTARTGKIAVSYTHLDVYKRQGEGEERGEEGRNQLNQTQSTMGHMKKSADYFWIDFD